MCIRDSLLLSASVREGRERSLSLLSSSSSFSSSSSLFLSRQRSSFVGKSSSLSPTSTLFLSSSLSCESNAVCFAKRHYAVERVTPERYSSVTSHKTSSSSSSLFPSSSLPLPSQNTQEANYSTNTTNPSKVRESKSFSFVFYFFFLSFVCFWKCLTLCLAGGCCDQNCRWQQSRFSRRLCPLQHRLHLPHHSVPSLSLSLSFSLSFVLTVVF